MIRHLLTLKDYKKEEIKKILDKAVEIKNNPAKYCSALKDKTLIMLFQKTSTRTRLSFEAGMTQLGGHGIFFDWRTTQFKMSEFSDEIKATMRFGDILMYRPLEHESLTKAEKVATIPIINALCEKYHPCQAFGDALTMIEKSGGKAEGLKGKKVVYLGIGNNVSNSLSQICTKLGANFTLCVPEKDPISVDKELLKQVKDTGLYNETTDTSCVADADFVYTDTWVNMEFFDDEGKVISQFKSESEERKEMFMPYQLSKELLDKNNSSAKIMHCMPCHIGYEITRDAIDHPNSIIFDQAENRLHVQKAIMLFLLNKF